jgi:hypothetical protein
MQAIHVLVVLHVIFGALWFGGPLLIGSTIKSALPHGRPAIHAAAGVANRMATFGLVGNLGSLLTGVGLIFWRYGGMKGLPVRFHIALGLGLIGAVLGFVLLKPTASKLLAAAGAEGFTAEAAGPAKKRLAMATGINHLLWLVALTLMYAY